MSRSQGIEYHRTALLRVVVGLFALAGFVPGGAAVSRVSAAVRAKILRSLRPAETATRRLALYLAHRVVLSEPRQRSAVGTGKSKLSVLGQGKKARKAVRKSGPRAPVFRLFDQRKYFPELADSRKRFIKGPGPRIWLLDGFDHLRHPAKPETSERDPEDAARLCRRMQALHRALSDMPAQAKRLAREMARREKAPPGPGRYDPMRPGYPPGYRENRTLEVDELLWVCHAMAFHDRAPFDSS